MEGVKLPEAAHDNTRITMKYKIALHKSEEGFSVSVPGLPGCWSQGESEEQALANIKDAIREYLAVAGELAGTEVREIDVAV
jgi:predicted RNase H-like HicB family nuclease